jgi:hypothetical protein
MQSSLILGDTLNFTTSVVDYPPSDGWTLKFRLIPRSTGTPITITTAQDSADSSLHRAQVTAATTAAWTAGEYSWASWVEKAAEKYSVSNGSITLKPDPRIVSTLDSRSTARVALDNVRAVINGKASSGVLSYRIGERQLQNYSMAELLQLESKLVADVKREQACEDLAAGLPNRRKVHVRLDRA